MTILFKLTTQDHKTRAGHDNECKWGPGVTHYGDARHTALCSPGFIHAYTDPLLAILLNPIHANITDPVLWKAEGDIAAAEGQLKVGCRSLTTLQILPVPAVTTEQRVKFAILCGKAVYKNAAWNTWADDWLAGKDRTWTAAEAAEAGWAEAGWAEAARARARAAAAAAAAAEAEAAAAAAEAEAAAAAAAAAAAGWAARAVDLATLAHQAVE